MQSESKQIGRLTGGKGSKTTHEFFSAAISKSSPEDVMIQLLRGAFQFRKGQKNERMPPLQLKYEVRSRAVSYEVD